MNKMKFHWNWITIMLLLSLLMVETSQTLEVGQRLNVTLDLNSCGTQATLQWMTGNGTCDGVEPLPDWLHWFPIVRSQGHVSINSQKRILVRHGWAYLVDQTTRNLHIIDVSDPWHPMIVKNYNLGGIPTGLDLMMDRFLVISQWGSKVQVIDVNNPFAPITVMCCVGDNYLNDVVVNGRWVYVASSNGYLQIIDFSNLTSPIIIRQMTTISTPIRMAIQKSSLYLLEQSELQIADLSIASNPTWEATKPLTGQPLDLTITTTGSCQTVHVNVMTTTEIQMVDVTIPASPKLTMTISLSNFSFSGTSVGFTRNGQWIYIVDGKWLSRIDLLDSQNLLDSREPVIDHLYLDNNTLITTDGFKIYTVGSHGLQIYDLSQVILEGTPNMTDVGQYQIRAIGFNFTLQSMICLNQTIDVIESAPPIITHWIRDRPECDSVGIGYQYNCSINGIFSNQYREPMTHTLQVLDQSSFPTWFKWNQETLMITGIPTTTMTMIIQVTATNPRCGLSATQNWTLTIVPTLLLRVINTSQINYQPTIPSHLGDLVVSTPSSTIAVQMMINPPNLGTLSTETIGGATSTSNNHVWQVNGQLTNVNQILSRITFQSTADATSNGTLTIQVNDSLGQMVVTTLRLVMTKMKSEKSRLTLIIGLIFGVVCIILFAIIVVWWYIRHRHKQKILYQSPETPKTLMMDTIRIDSSKVRQIKSKDLEIGRILGQGGFGIVYKGIWKSGGDIEVAVKKLNPGCETMREILTSFEKEIELMSGFRHPNIVQIYGVCHDVGGSMTSNPCSGSMYSIVMEFMAGGALDKVLYDRSRDLPETLRSSIIDDCVSGLVYLHSQGIMHRDIKSANVLIDHNHRAKWTDFGISRVVDEQQKTMTKGQGTVPWMAPEIIRGDTHYTIKADVYSFGMLLWEMVARQPPFKEVTNQFQIYEHILSGTRPDLPTTAPPFLSGIIQWCWQTDVEARPTMEQIQQQLKEKTHTTLTRLSAPLDPI